MLYSELGKKRGVRSRGTDSRKGQLCDSVVRKVESDNVHNEPCKEARCLKFNVIVVHRYKIQ